MVLFHKLNKHFAGDLKGLSIAIWGLSFKPNTNDVREAPSLVLIEQLLLAGANVRVYDPEAMHEAKISIERTISDLPIANIYYAPDIYDAVLDADALLLVTEWKEFRMPSWGVVKKTMKNALVLDGRNIYNVDELKDFDIVYESIG